MPKLWKVFLDLLFPPRCVFCGKVLKGGEKDMCEACKDELPYTHGVAVTQKGEYFDACISPFYYKDNVKESIKRFKFKDASKYASCYGRILADCIRENLDGEYDLMSWVPISAHRMKTRGYDQSMLIAYATALELGDVAVETLVKKLDTPAQSSLEAARRKVNVEGAFEIKDAELIKDKRVLLIDDIVTTGSTLNECSKKLLDCGATKVVCASIARTEASEMYIGSPG